MTDREDDTGAPPFDGPPLLDPRDSDPPRSLDGDGEGDADVEEALVPLGAVLEEIERRTADAASETAEQLLQRSRMPPAALDAERGVLGALLLEPAAYEIVLDEGLRADDFYRPTHGTIFRIVQDLHARAEPIDTLTVVDELLKQGKLEQVGGAAAISQLEALLPTAAHVGAYARIVREKAQLRQLIETATDIVQSAFRQDRRVVDVLDDAERQILAISEASVRKGIVPMSELVRRATEQLEKAYNNKSAITGVACGFRDLDTKYTSGFQPGELIIVAARPSMGKCLAHDAEIVLEDGSVITIEEVVRRRDARLFTLDEGCAFRPTTPSAFVDDGVKPVFRVTTRLGRSVDTTITHPFLTLDGWRRLEEIAVGTPVAVPRRLASFGKGDLPEHEVKLLAYLIGDGCLVDSSPEFTNTNPRIQEEFLTCLEAFGGVRSRIEAQGGRAATVHVATDRSQAAEVRHPYAADLDVVMKATGTTGRAVATAAGVSPALVTGWRKARLAPDARARAAVAALLGVELVGEARRDATNPLVALLQRHALWGKGAHTKCVPDAVFRLRRPLVASFLNRLFATDGWFTVLASGQPQAGFATVSARLAKQVQHLLVRFGVLARLKRRSIAYRSERREAWQLDVTDAASLRILVDEIGAYGKEPAVDAVRAALTKRAARLTRVHRGDVVWDEIVSIEPLGDKQVYDLTIDDTHNFVANDVCVHNTAWTLNVAAHVAVRLKEPVMFFSLEMGAEQLVQRLIGAEARIDISSLRKGFIQRHEWSKLAEAAGRLSEAPFFIDETPSISVAEMRNKARRQMQQTGLSMIIVDYLQLMRGPEGYDNKATEVGEISKGLKTIARELSIPVIALSQLNRGVESRTDKRPMMSDLRESGAIEQDADVIAFLYREEYYLKDKTPEDKLGIAEVIIAKNRNGPTGGIELRFFSNITRFENLEKQHDDYAP